MRVKQEGNVPDLPYLGITPAHAGKTLRMQRYIPTVRDHPRACG